MEEDIRDQTSMTQEVSQDIDHEAKLPEDKAESAQGVRKSSRPRKQSKRVLDSVDCNDIELVSIPVKKKHRRDLKLKTGYKKDILPNGRPFKCSLCESPYINNSPAKAKVKKELQPIVKEKCGQLLQLCVKCAIAVNHTESKGPTPEQREEFEDEGKQFAQHVVEYLNDSAAARLYCSFYQTTKCGCIQSYITGIPANRKRKTSLSGAEWGTSDSTELKLEDGVISVDDKAEQAQRAKYLLSLLKESMAKKQAPNSKKFNEKSQLAPDDTANMMKESEKFILSNRVKLKELGICERGCQKVLCYSNNFLHKKSVGNQPRLQRTKGRAALGRLHAIQDLHKMRCCEKNCVKLAERSQAKVDHWRQRAQQGQKEMWKVLEEMLTFTDAGKTNCFKFISMVTGCCLTTVQKIYAGVLLSKGAAGGASEREHGMRFHWKRQKELGKSQKGQSMTTANDQPEVSESFTSGCSGATTDTYIDQTCFSNQTGTCDSDVTKERLMPQLTVDCPALPKTKPQLCKKDVEENGEKADIKETFLQLVETIRDPQDIASVQQMLDKLKRDLKIKQSREHTEQGFSSQVPRGSPGATMATFSSASSSVSCVTSTSQTPTCSSSVSTGIFSQATQDIHMASVLTSKTGRPFVHIKVQQAVSAEQKTSAPQLPHSVCREQKIATTLNTDLDFMQSAQTLAQSAKDAMQVVDLYTVKSETGSSQIVSQPIILSSLSTQPGIGTVQSKAGIPVSLPLVIGSSTISSFVGTSPVTISSKTHNSLDHLPQQVNLFQVMSNPDTESSHLSTQASQILSVYPQPAPLHIQALPLSSSSNTQNVQFQLVSPLIMGQSDLMIPFNQPGTMSLILPKQAANGSQNSDLLLQSHSLTPVVHKDSLVSQVSAMQQSFQNLPASSEAYCNEVPTNNHVYSFPLQTECNLSASNNTSNIHYAKLNKTISSLCSGVLETSESTHNQSLRIHLDQPSGTVIPLSDIPSHFQMNRTLKSQDSGCSSNTQSIAAMNFHSIQNNGQEGEVVHQVNNIDQYFSSSLLSQPSGNIITGTPSSCSSGSFVFDALADSPVKDSLPVSSSSLQQGPFITSPLLCEMLRRSTVPSVSSMSSPHMHDYVSSVASSSSASVLSTTSCESQTPVHIQNSQSLNSMKSSLLISALKSPPVTSTYCQSLNFSTHTTPSTLSNQPMVTTGKLEQTILPVGISMGHSTSLGHSQKSVGRLNRQREPPQVGIVHPHISGVKSGFAHTATSSLSSSSNISSLSHNSVHSLPVSNSSVAHLNVFGEFLPAATSTFAALDSTNFQVAASVQDLSEDIPADQSHTQQHLLSVLLNSQQAANFIDHQSLINILQPANQFTLSSLLGHSSNLANTVSVDEKVCQSQTVDSDFQNKIGTGDCNTSLQNVPNHSSQNATADGSNFLPNQTLESMSNQTVLSVGNQNIFLGRASTQLQTGGPHIFQNMVCSNTGHVKLIPVILSDGHGNSSVPSLFPQNGQLFLNMSPCSGMSSLSPQSLNRDNGILLNTSPNSSQSICVQHPLPQSVGNTQTASSFSLPSSSIQNLHQLVEVSPVSKDQTRTLQVSVIPFGSQFGNTQTQSPKNVNHLALGAATNEFQNANNFESHLSVSTSDSIGSVVGTIHAQTALPCTNRAQNMYEKDNQNFQPIHTKSENSNAGQSVFVPVSNSLTKINTNSKVPDKAIVKTVTSLSRLKKPRLLNQTKSSDFTQSDDSDCQNTGSDPNSLVELKPQVSLFNQTVTNVEHLAQHSSIEYSMQQHKLPFHVISTMHTPEEQTNTDKVLSSCVGKNIVLGQQLLNVSSPNQIFLPVESVPFNKHLGSCPTMSNTIQGLQLDQNVLDLHKVSLNTPCSDTTSGTTSLMPEIQVIKNVSIPSTCTSVQSAIANSGSQHASMATSCSSTSKHRPIRPKLQPVPAPAPKVSLMLFPDKPGYPAYQLTQLDQAVLSVQQDRTLPQVQIVSQQPQKSVLVPGNSQQLQNNLLVQGNNQQLQSTLLIPGNSQLLLNTLLVPGNSQQPQNRLLVSDNSPQQRAQKPIVNTAIMSQLQSSQQPNVPAQILLVSHTHQGTENLEIQPISRQQNETLQSSQQTNTIIQPLHTADKEHQAVSHQGNVPDILSQQTVTTERGPSQVTSVSCEVSEVSLLENRTLKDSSAQNGVLQIIPSENKGYQVGVFHNGPMFVSSLSSDTLHGETFEVDTLQSNECEPSSLHFGSVEVNVSEYDTSQNTSQLSCLPSRTSKFIPVQMTVQSDIQRLNPQVASQLSGGGVLMAAQQKLISAHSPNIQGHLIMTSYQPELNESQVQVMKGHNMRSDTTPSSLVDPTFPYHLQSKLSTEDFTVQTVGDKGVDKAALNMTQLSSHVASSDSFSVLAYNLQTSPIGPVTSSILPPNFLEPSSEIPVYTKQLLHKLTQQSTLAVGTNMSTANEDTKPMIEPVQYLQCKEVIDLTDDSPPLSPFTSANNKDKALSLVPISSVQPKLYKEQQKQILFDSHMSSQQGTVVMQLQNQNLFQQNQPKENQHLQQQWDQLKQEDKEVSHLPSEIMPENSCDGSSLPVVSSNNKRDQISMMLEELPEVLRQDLIASLEAHAAGNPDVQLVTRTFTPSDDLSYQGFLSSNGSSQQTEEQFNAITKAISKNKCPSAVVTISTNQRFQQSLARVKSQASSVALKSLVADSKLDAMTLTCEYDKRLPPTAHRSVSSNLNPELSSLSAVGTAVNLKQVMDLPSTAQVPSRSSSTASLLSDVNAVVKSDQNSASMTLALTSHKLSITSSPLLLQTTALPTIPAVKTSAGRSVIHPMTSSSTVAFMRTTNTPTDAVGPPNITIMSPAQASSSPLLRFRHESNTNTVSVTTAVMSQAVTSACPNALPIISKSQSSGLLKLTNCTTSVPVRLQGAHEVKQLALYASSVGKDKVAGHLTRKLSLESTFQTGLKEVPCSDASSPSLSSSSVDDLIKSMESSAPPRPKSRRKPSTVMDLLKSKEKLQATTSATSSPGTPVSSTPGPVTLMISGTAGTPNLYVMDSSLAQPRVDPNALNITVKNLQLLGKCNDKSLASKQIPPSSQPSGFTILQPYTLPTSVSNGCNVVSAPVHVTPAAVLDQNSTAALGSMPSPSHLQSQTSTSKTGSMSHKISLPAQNTTSGSPFLGNMPQPKVHQDVLNQKITSSNQSSTSQSGSGNQRTKVSFSSVGISLSDNISPKVPSTTEEDSDFKEKKLQEIIKSEAEEQFQLIGQPQVANGSFSLQSSSPAIDFFAHKTRTPPTDAFKVEKLKFKSTSTKKTGNEDRHQEISSQRLQPVEDSQRIQLTQSTGTIKKLLLLNDKSSGRDTQSSSSLNADLEMGYNRGLSTEHKQLSLKSPQLLQLMKSKQFFSNVALDQSVHSNISSSSGHDKSHHLKLLTSSNSMPISGDATIHNYSAVQQASCHQSKPQQRDQLPALKAQLAVPVIQPKENETRSLETTGKASVGESSSSTRRNHLTTQNPLLAHILFPTTSSSIPSNFSSSFSVSNSPLQSENFTSSFSVSNSPVQSENQAKTSDQWSCEEIRHQQGSIAFGHQTSSEQLGEQFLENKNERHVKCSFETENKTGLNVNSVSNQAPPAYSQLPRHIVAPKDMTRVNRVIEDIYKFPDEGDESSPPPVFGGFKSQTLSQKFHFVQYGHRKPSDSSYEANNISHPQSLEGASNSTLPKFNMKSAPSTAQYANGHPTGKSCLSAGLTTQIWKSPKKLKTKKHHDKSGKFNPKKVQFSDVVTSKSTSEYGQSITVNSNIDAVPNEVPSNYIHDAHVAKRSHADLSRNQYPLEIDQHLLQKQQNVADDNQDDQVKHEHSGQFEATLTRSGNLSVNGKDPVYKTFGLTYIQREEDGLGSSDVGAGHHHAKEAHKVLLHQHFPKVSQKASVTALMGYEQGVKQQEDRDVSSLQAFRHIDQSPYTYQSVSLQDYLGNTAAFVSDKIETRLHNIQTLRTSSDQMVALESYRNINNQCDDSKAEGMNRFLTKRRKPVFHDESFQFNTASEYGNDIIAERKQYIAEKKMNPLSPNVVTGNEVRDTEFDQQSSFNILSTQGYSKLSRQRLRKTHSDHPWVESSTSSAVQDTQFSAHAFTANDTNCSSDQFEEVRDFPQQTKCNPVLTCNVATPENVERQPSESPLIRQKMLESNFELARQMKKGHVHILKDSGSEASEGRQIESPQNFIMYSQRKSEGNSSSLIHRDNECHINKEMEFRTLSGPASKLTSPIFSDSLDGRSDVLSSLESLSHLRKEIKNLAGENQYLKIEVAKAEKEKEQQRQRQLSSSDKQKGIVTEVEKMYYTSPSSTNSQPHVADGDNVVPPRKRHSSSTTTVGILNCSINNPPPPGSEQSRQEEGFQNRVINPSLIFSSLEPEISALDSGLRGRVAGLLYSRSVNNTDDYSPPENYIRDTRDPFVSSSMSSHSRPTSQLELAIPLYDSVRHRYPSGSSRGISDGDGFVPLQEHTRHRNLSSSLGLRVLNDVDPPPYDITLRQRNPSASSVKSSYQDADLPNFDQGVRSRNPSSTSGWIRYWDTLTSDFNVTVVRSRNPSGSSSRRSRPGSSSSDRELTVNMDELPLFSDFARTRSRNSSGESIEPTVEFLDPQQFMQYTYPAVEAHIKRTKH